MPKVFCFFCLHISCSWRVPWPDPSLAAPPAPTWNADTATAPVPGIVPRRLQPPPGAHCCCCCCCWRRRRPTPIQRAGAAVPHHSWHVHLQHSPLWRWHGCPLPAVVSGPPGRALPPDPGRGAALCRGAHAGARRHWPALVGGSGGHGRVRARCPAALYSVLHAQRVQGCGRQGRPDSPAQRLPARSGSGCQQQQQQPRWRQRQRQQPPRQAGAAVDAAGGHEGCPAQGQLLPCALPGHAPAAGAAHPGGSAGRQARSAAGRWLL